MFIFRVFGDFKEHNSTFHLPSSRLEEIGDAGPPAAALAEGWVWPDEGLAIGGAACVDELAAGGEGDMMEDLIIIKKAGGGPR